MKITVLGKSPAWQDAGGACSGYLVEEGDYRLLVDCGNGVFGKLRDQVDYEAVDAVVITHLHSDHCFDLIPYAYALSYSPLAQSAVRPRPNLYAPPGGRAAFRTITGTWQLPELVEQAFCMFEYDPDEQLEIGPLTLRFQEVPHYIRTFAVRISAGGRSFTFGADCCPNDAIVALGRETDLMMLEATLEQPEEGHRGHLTAAEAGEHGRRAGARRLVLTHFSASPHVEVARADAERAFGGPVEQAAEGVVFTV